MRLNKAVLGVALMSALSLTTNVHAKSHHQDVKESKQKHHGHKKGKRHFFHRAHRAEITSLAGAARTQRKLMGSAVSYGSLNSADALYAEVFNREFDYMTPENSGKWGVLQADGPGQWDFSAHDFLVDYAEDNHKAYKGHTLVWHSQMPSWVDNSLTAEELQQYITEHMETTMARYQGKMFAWDVVNEAVDDSGAMRDSIYLQKLGINYIADAFHLAHSLDPRAHLYYNDYNIAGINAKSDAVYNLLSDLIAQGVPVDGIGFQMHLTASGAPSYDELVANFQRFHDLGLKINISELDVRVSDLPWDRTTKLAIQRQIYHRVTSACVQFRSCESLTTWGFTDAYSWVDSTFGEDDPLPLDETYQRKPAYYGLLDGFVNITPDAAGTMPNLLDNGQFEADTQGWVAWGGTIDRVSRHSVKRHMDKHRRKALRRHARQDEDLGRSAMIISDRSELWHSAAYDITNVLQPGRNYSAEATAAILNADEDLVALSVFYRCEGEDNVYLNIANETIEEANWATISGSFTAPECTLEEAALYIEGPEVEVDILVDGVALRPATLVPDSTGLGDNIVVNSDFESGADGWFGFGPAAIEVTDVVANSGSQSGYVTQRTATWQGPATSLFLDAEAGKEYRLLAWVRAESGAAQINGTVKATCAEGDQYMLVGSSNASTDAWSTISGTFTAPNCELLDLTLYFEGPAAGENFYIDDVYVQEVLKEEETDNLLSNGTFESGTAGWSAWGGTLMATTLQAHSGSYSVLLSNRSASWQGPVYDLLGSVIAGEQYSVSAWGRIQGASADTLNITVKTACSDGSEAYHQLASITATDTDWSELSGAVTLPNCDLTQVFLYFDGPAVGVDTFLDDVVVTGASASAGNLVDNADFESDLSGWSAWAGTLSITNTAHTGNQAAQLSGRTANWQGPVYSLTGKVEAGATYDFSGWAMIQGAASSSVNITVKTTCDDGSEAYNWAGSNNVVDYDWTEVAGTLTMPSCTLVDVVMYFDGPDAGIDTLLDDVSVTLSM